MQSSAGKREGLEAVMNEYGTAIKHLIYTYVKNWETAGDLSQDVFVTVYEKWDTFEGRASIKTWIYKIAANKAKDHLKSWNHRKVNLFEHSFESEKAERLTLEDQAVLREEKEQVLSLMMAMPVKYRELLLLHFEQELTYQEIADILNLPLSTVKTRIRRGSEKLKTSYIYQERRGTGHE
ncbi:hypothetical protein KP77_08290 [Jeotgalibacillus alimentarius]|uniref:Uncharacterized protein n=1 Tax=Jeotgalibacillus alimentarius TaxID=135826 RepID=A0A0C2VQW6_9BACL|nr:sigma-70 family RNA polymerase sigma factor [Jeotgalibacillus alimentarius]KIL51317.1 hypothetical protein KP77_08290 [Jeotgalibacillus alimentarius]